MTQYPPPPELETKPDTGVESLEISNLTITVMIEGIQFSRSLTDDLNVSEDEINRWLKEQPTKMAYWSIWSGRAEVILDAMEHNLKKVEAEAYAAERKKIYDQYKTEFHDYAILPPPEQKVQAKPKEPTADVYKYAIEYSPEYREAVNKVIQAKEVVKYMKSAVTALYDLRSTLISLSSNMRSERDSYRTQNMGNNYGEEESRPFRPQNISNVNDAVKTVTQSFVDSVNTNKVDKIKTLETSLSPSYAYVPVASAVPASSFVPPAAPSQNSMSNLFQSVYGVKGIMPAPPSFAPPPVSAGMPATPNFTFAQESGGNAIYVDEEEPYVPDPSIERGDEIPF
jgi:hypothetical protein